jgi:signal transduction histidine kinase/ActR/RegA family two-component response regulator
MEEYVHLSKPVFFNRLSAQLRKEKKSEVFPLVTGCFLLAIICVVDVLLATQSNLAFEPLLVAVAALVGILSASIVYYDKKWHQSVPVSCFVAFTVIALLVANNGAGSGIFFYYLPVIVILIIYGSNPARKINFRVFSFVILAFLLVVTLGFIYSKSAPGNSILYAVFLYRLNVSVLASSLLLRYLMPVYINRENLVARMSYPEALFQSGTEAYIIFNNDTGVITDCNNTTSRLFELPAAMNLKELYISQFMMRYLTGENENLEVLMNNIPQNWQGEANFRTYKKNEFTGCIDTRTFIDKGTTFQLLAIKDITKMKEPVKQLDSYKARLENSVKVKTRFLSSMSHELRTPLNGIIGTSNLILEDETISEDAREQLKLQLYSSEHMLSIINDILDFSKIDSGKIEFSKQPFSLPDVLQKITKAFEGRFKTAKLDFEVIIDSSLDNIYVASDEVKLSQVLNNLLSNALKFTMEGKVLLRAMPENDDNEHVSVHFSVSDTGIGIKQEKLAEIFDGFSQVHADELKRKFGGTGLGLTISKKLVELFGSNLLVESEFGKGTCFSFSINFKKHTKIHRPQVQPDNPFAETDIRGVRVLIVEDNEINVTILRGFLKKWGIRIKEANNGIHALELIKYHKFDLILMDLEMPEMNGYTAVNIIRQTNTVIPIIAFTATLLEDMDALISKEGFNDYMLKPFRPAELKKKIEMYSPHRKIEYAS